MIAHVRREVAGVKLLTSLTACMVAFSCLVLGWNPHSLETAQSRAVASTFMVGLKTSQSPRRPCRRTLSVLKVGSLQIRGHCSRKRVSPPIVSRCSLQASDEQHCEALQNCIVAPINDNICSQRGTVQIHFVFLMQSAMATKVKSGVVPQLKLAPRDCMRKPGSRFLLDHR